MNTLTLARALAINRIGFGLGYIFFPGRAGRGWIGAAADDPRTRIFTRALGARDLALAAGALLALSHDGNEARPWMAGQALADGIDLAATLSARRALPARNVVFAAGMAGASTAIALAAALRPDG